jgi:crotonobetainyl-CoA:carnitine CoA-transferase CaiB-like acyl-CoA transferase
VSAHPLADIRVVDFGHTVMGPTAGLILADLGADVIRVEPVAGDPTRSLMGFGAGYFGMYNRNKRSFAADLKSDEGRELAFRLLDTADVLIENFGPGTIDRLGLGYDAVIARNPRLIFASLKGFMAGPHEQRLALDEVVQMMTGLAYMTGPSGRPLRAGTSLVDITGGMFAVIGILTALRERERTGRGTKVDAALYETAVFMMGQHLCVGARTGKPVPPMPERVSAWAIYEPFGTSDNRHVFVGITSDQHWQRFCGVAGRDDLATDATLSTNNQRIAARSRLVPILAALFSKMTAAEAEALCARAKIPHAPVARPEDLLIDRHLEATNGLLETQLPDGITAQLPRLPLAMGDLDTDKRCDPPAVGESTASLLAEWGYDDAAIADLVQRGIVAV